MNKTFVYFEFSSIYVVHSNSLREACNDLYRTGINVKEENIIEIDSNVVRIKKDELVLQVSDGTE